MINKKEKKLPSATNNYHLTAQPFQKKYRSVSRHRVNGSSRGRSRKKLPCRGDGHLLSLLHTQFVITAPISRNNTHLSLLDVLLNKDVLYRLFLKMSLVSRLVQYRSIPRSWFQVAPPCPCMQTMDEQRQTSAAGRRFRSPRSDILGR